MVEIKWMPQAIQDIDHIAEYIAKDSLKYAKIQTERFFSSTDILLKNPRAGRIVPEMGKSNIREIIMGNYRIIYHIVTLDRIDILAVHNSARLLGKLRLK